MSVEKTKHHSIPLWSSYIHTIKYKQKDIVNNKLAEIAEKYCEETFNFDTDFKHSRPANVLLLYKDPSLVWLFNEVKLNLFQYINQHYSIKEEDIDVDYNMWGNVEGFAEWSLPHAHHGNQLVITYYPYVNVDRTAHKYAGSFCWHPTATYMPDFMVRKEPAFYPEILETGSMVIFNGYAPHSTFPSFNKNDKKVALITNIRFRLKGSKQTYTPSKEILEFQLSK